MSGIHKNPTISFRITDSEWRQIEAKIIASGMRKKDYFIRSCIYNQVCVVGKKETVYRLVEELREMQAVIRDVAEQFQNEEVTLTKEGVQEMQTDFVNMLAAILWMLDGARYLWEGRNGSGDQTEVSVTQTESVAKETKKE